VVEAVIFDVDGTLIDSVDLHAKAWQEAFQHFGKVIPFAQVREQIGKGADQLLPVFFTSEQLERFGKDLEEFRQGLYKRKYMRSVKAFPRVRELMLRIRSEGLKILLASSAKEEELEFYQHLINCEDLIEEQATADDANRSKPHPDIFAGALKRGRISAEKAIAVGDTPYDAEAAGKIHLSTIGMLCGGFPEEKLRTAGCIEIFRDPADLLERYDRSALASPEVQAA
jgi:HAD superfamily hydrolase (TIGR01509 family)